MSATSPSAWNAEGSPTEGVPDSGWKGTFAGAGTSADQSIVPGSSSSVCYNVHVSALVSTSPRSVEEPDVSGMLSDYPELAQSDRTASDDVQESHGPNDNDDVLFQSPPSFIDSPCDYEGNVLDAAMHKPLEPARGEAAISRNVVHGTSRHVGARAQARSVGSSSEKAILDAWGRRGSIHSFFDPLSLKRDEDAERLASETAKAKLSESREKVDQISMSIEHFFQKFNVRDVEDRKEARKVKEKRMMAEQMISQENERRTTVEERQKRREGKKAQDDPDGSIAVSIPVKDEQPGSDGSGDERPTGATPPRSTMNVVRALDSVSKRLEPADIRLHVVRAGDTVASIALDFGVLVSEITRANPGLSATTGLFVGRRVLIPQKISRRKEPVDPFAETFVATNAQEAAMRQAKRANTLNRIVSGTFGIRAPRSPQSPMSPASPLGDEPCAESESPIGSDEEDHYLKTHAYEVVAEIVSESAVERVIGEVQNSVLLKPRHIAKFLRFLPSSVRFQSWQILFTTERDGVSLSQLYASVHRIDHTVVIVKDSNRHIFGGFASSPWKISEKPFGGADSFVFTLEPEFACYQWAKRDHFFQYARDDRICFGCGGGEYAFALLNGELCIGVSSGKCQTFASPRLASTEQFETNVVEVWGFDTEIKKRGSIRDSGFGISGARRSQEPA